MVPSAFVDRTPLDPCCGPPEFLQFDRAPVTLIKSNQMTPRGNLFGKLLVMQSGPDVLAQGMFIGVTARGQEENGAETFFPKTGTAA